MIIDFKIFENNKIENIINGEIFTKTYVDIPHGYIAKVLYKKNINIGANMGDGSYWNVTQDCLNTYCGLTIDSSAYKKYVSDVIYKKLSHSARIYVKNNISFELEKEIENNKYDLYNKIKKISDGVYDPENDSYGLLIFNLKVLLDVEKKEPVIKRYNKEKFELNEQLVEFVRYDLEETISYYIGEDFEDGEIENKIKDLFKNKFILFWDEYGKMKEGIFNDLLLYIDEYGEINDIYIKIDDEKFHRMSEDNRIVNATKDEVEEKKPVIRWYKGGVLEGKEEYPFKKTIDLIDMGNSCCMPNDDFPDYNEFERKLKRKILYQYCRFQEEVETHDNKGHYERKKGEFIEGVVIDVEIESFFDMGATIKFTVIKEVVYPNYILLLPKYEVHPYTPVEIYLKKERKKQTINPELDPYGEEDWDNVQEGIKHADIDPYGEENWDENKETSNDGRIKSIFITAGLQRIRGRQMATLWAINKPQIPSKFYKKDRKLSDEFENFDEDTAGFLIFSDYYDDCTRKYKCPKCGKVSNRKRKHGDAFKCGKCGLFTRIYGNGLYIWE
jgi:ribosomal protein S27AE